MWCRKYNIMLKSKTYAFLKQNGSLKGTSSLSRGNGQLITKTRISGRAKASGRVIEGKKIWSLQEADRKIKEYVFKRDGYRCVVTGDTEFLTPSHYYGRGNYAVRFYPDNLITLDLWKHTDWENKEMKDTEYKDFMIKFIGKERFKELNRKAHENGAMKKEDAIIELMRFLGELSEQSK